jgi:hypothetical protein
VCHVPAVHALWMSVNGMRIRALDTRTWTDVTPFIETQSGLANYKISKLARADGADMVFGASESGGKKRE